MNINKLKFACMPLMLMLGVLVVPQCQAMMTQLRSQMVKIGTTSSSYVRQALPPKIFAARFFRTSHSPQYARSFFPTIAAQSQQNLRNCYSVDFLFVLASAGLAEYIFHDHKQSVRSLDFKDSITALYKQHGGNYRSATLYLSEKERSLCRDAGDLEKLCGDYGIISTDDSLWFKKPKIWDQEKWKYAYEVVSDRALDEANGYSGQLSLEQSVQLLQDAKTILKSFLGNAENEPAFKKQGYIIKQGINRLFTYAKLQYQIEKQKLLYVYLPKKMLLVRDNRTGQYLSVDEASKLIDSRLKINLSSSQDLAIAIEYLDDLNYDFYILAERKSCSKKGLSEFALADLDSLIRTAPFDVGCGNIFSDENGDAIIIDTEFKGESAQSCVPKLFARYGSSRLK